MIKKVWLGLMLPLVGVLVAMALMAHGTPITRGSETPNAGIEPLGNSDGALLANGTQERLGPLEGPGAAGDQGGEAPRESPFPEPTTLAIVGAGLLTLTRRSR
ncbi:MAG: hypothetical protein KC931_02495 [Candidatus Omnitrophica bacterium]|nr:hypothetical protein [Candidatus Omnitrophota bacterium]MCA9445958.1 hypothetical protein [Candidatus Omnitrophota bacterium]MCB9768765.1 hypothetical protein [Candidatus Omnitrophota bacterium]